MKGSVTSLPCFLPFLCCTLHILSKVLTTHACTFPDFLQWREGDEEFNWHSRIRNGRVRESAYSIRHNVIEVSHSTSALKPVRWKCALTYHNKFLVRRQDLDSARSYSACVKFLQRSSSIVQMMWSAESSSVDPTLCDDDNLVLDPWPLVSFKHLLEDFTPSPFQGGFNMRITDSQNGENGCNYMHRPMKFESDCLTGEGVILDFISKSCVPEVASFFVRQPTLPLASWEYQGNHYVIIRRHDAQDVFCLRMPAAEENHMTAFLFTDLACLTAESTRLKNVQLNPGVRYLVLHLQRYVYRRLCDDEYPQCSAVTCSSYIQHECQKSCKVCDVKRPPPTCSFPRRYRGHWHQTDVDGFHKVSINDTDLTIDKVGSFRCIMYPDSPARKTRMYTTVSMFANGCRPRYTCIKLKRLGPSVLSYALSRSSVWPDLEKDFGQAICSVRKFSADPEPINDLYRSHEDTGKPMVSDTASSSSSSSSPAVPERIPCNLSSSFTITDTMLNGSHCMGDLFEHCEDSTRLRIQFHSQCGEMLHREQSLPHGSEAASSSSWQAPAYTDYFCLANYEGHYWERILLLQSTEDVEDVRCLIFTQLDASVALVMISGQCDKNSWHYVRAGLRTPLMSLKMEPEEFPCKFLPETTAPSTTVRSRKEGEGLYSVQGGGGDTAHLSSLSFTLHVTPPHQHRPGSSHRISASYEEHHERDKTVIDSNPELSPRGNNPGSSGVSYSARIALGFRGAVIALGSFVYWVNR